MCRCCESNDAHIHKLVAAAPPVTPEQKAALKALFRTHASPRVSAPGAATPGADQTPISRPPSNETEDREHNT